MGRYQPRTAARALAVAVAGAAGAVTEPVPVRVPVNVPVQNAKLAIVGGPCGDCCAAGCGCGPKAKNWVGVGVGEDFESAPRLTTSSQSPISILAGFCARIHCGRVTPFPGEGLRRPTVRPRRYHLCDAAITAGQPTVVGNGGAQRTAVLGFVLCVEIPTRFKREVLRKNDTLATR